MKRWVWKWGLGLSIAALVLLFLLTVGSYLMLNVAGALLLSLMGNTEITAIPPADFLENFVGSPMFWICLADIAVLILSAAMLVVTKKEK